MGRAGVIGSRAGPTSRSGWVAQRIASVSNPDGTIKLDTDMGALSTGLAQDAADAVSGTFEDRIPPYLRTVRSYWPYKSGYSQGRFRLKIKPAGDFFMVSLINDAPYSGWIRHMNERPVLVAVRLLFNPFSPVAKMIASDIADYLGDTYGG